ncbi:alpha/beta hydrolase [Verrucomicrobia bacterium S94]|nr:alpha/beta hydrolase [Verrucomicrobia bacterium S94]
MNPTTHQSIVNCMLENPLIRYALYGGGVYLCLNLFAAVISDRILFQPQPPGYKQLPNEVRIPTTDGESINAVWLHNRDAEYTLFFSHGNGEDLSVVLPFLMEYYADHFSILAYDYRGYGSSDGTPSYRKAKDDAEAAYQWLVNKQAVKPADIIAIGRSLGGALAVQTAARHPVGGLICECSFASAFRVKTRVRILPWDKFNNEKAIATVQCPVLIIHGRDDRIVPFSHGQKLYNAAPEPKRHFWIDDARHMNYAYVAGDEYLKTILSFVAEL